MNFFKVALIALLVFSPQLYGSAFFGLFNVPEDTYQCNEANEVKLSLERGKKLAAGGQATIVVKDEAGKEYSSILQVPNDLNDTGALIQLYLNKIDEIVTEKKIKPITVLLPIPTNLDVSVVLQKIREKVKDTTNFTVRNITLQTDLKDLYSFRDAIKQQKNVFSKVESQKPAKRIKPWRKQALVGIATGLGISAFLYYLWQKYEEKKAKQAKPAAMSKIGLKVASAEPQE